MKKPLFLLICVLLLILAGAAPALARARTFVVHPSGGDDTARIQQAFDCAAQAGPGSTVQLTTGRFFINNILVQDFSGCFKGAGMGETVIDTLRGLDPDDPNLPGMTLTLDPDDPGTDDAPNYVEPWTFLIGFLGGDVRVSDMSFKLTSPDPAEPWSVDGGETMLSDVSDIFVISRDASSAFDRVGFSARAGDAQGYNTANDIGIYGPTGGVHSVTRCSFRGRQALEIVGLAGGRLTVGGRAALRNVFREYFAACYFYDNSDSDITISHNRMRATMGVDIFLHQGGGIFSDSVPPLPAPRFAIRDNVIRASKVTADDGGTVAGAGGVYVEDDSWFYGEANRLDAVIADNTILLDNDGWDAGIDGFYAQGVKVLRNRISGTALAAIDVGTPFIPAFPMEVGPASGWRIVGNDVSDLTASSAQLEPGVRTAPIWLGPGATGCLVVGGPGRTRVLDEGTDNILVNVIKLPLLGSARAAAPLKAQGMTKALKPAPRF